MGLESRECLHLADDGAQIFAASLLSHLQVRYHRILCFLYSYSCCPICAYAGSLAALIPVQGPIATVLASTPGLWRVRYSSGGSLVYTTTPQQHQQQYHQRNQGEPTTHHENSSNGGLPAFYRREVSAVQMRWRCLETRLSANGATAVEYGIGYVTEPFVWRNARIFPYSFRVYED